MSQHGCPERLSNRSKGFQEDGSQTTMEVLVETLTGTAFEMTVSPSDTIFAIKSKICRVEGIPVSQQHLVFGSRELEDACSLSAAGVRAGARLRLVLGLRGGPVSTRRLPAPRAPDPWRDIERLLHSNREDEEWGGGCTPGSGCRVTVVVFRDGERVNMLRVHESDSMPHHCHYSSPASEPSPCTTTAETPGAEAGGGASSEAVSQNALTMCKMMELRRRMEALALTRHNHAGEGEIQKTRSEETLSVSSLLEEPEYSYSPYSEAEDTFTPLLDGKYTRYECECAVGERYTLLPPVDDPPHPSPTADRLKLSDALAGSILVAGQDSAPNIPAAEYGPLVGGEGGHWRARGFGPGRVCVGAGLAGAGRAAGGAPSHARSASSLHVRPPALPPAPPLADALFSSSTSDLEHLRRNRLLPALSRHRNTEHLHLSDEQLHRCAHTPSTHTPSTHSTHTAHAAHTAGERRQRRIHRIAQMQKENSRAFNLSDTQPEENPPEIAPGDSKDKDTSSNINKKPRIRCGFCRKKLSIATTHTCRCGRIYCAPHRYAEVHGCHYDYKANAHIHLQRANPLVSAPKLPKI